MKKSDQKFNWKTLRDIPHHFHITMGSGIQKNDDELFFGPIVKRDPNISLDHYQHFDDVLTYDQLAVALDQMPSNSQARKNGWSGEIPEGYSEFKRKFHRFYILKLSGES